MTGLLHNPETKTELSTMEFLNFLKIRKPNKKTEPV